VHAWIEGAKRARVGLERGEGEIERDAEEMDGEEGGGQVFMVVKKSGEARLRRALPDAAAAKLGGGQTR
jgi:hypothetical protein